MKQVNENQVSTGPEVASRGAAKINSNPVSAYTIVMTLEGAPGPFEFVEGAAQYNVVNNDECGHINESAGVIEHIVNFETVPMRKISDTEYRGTIYRDLMQDEDYYGRGVCRWDLTYLRVNLRATGKDGETWFGPSISVKDIRSGGTSVLYFWSGRYPRSEMENYPYNGFESVEEVRPEIRKELFKITIRSLVEG